LRFLLVFLSKKTHKKTKPQIAESGYEGFWVWFLYRKVVCLG
jgi:hypothetical protein